MGKSIVATWQEQDHAHEAASIDTAINSCTYKRGYTRWLGKVCSGLKRDKALVIGAARGLAAAIPVFLGYRV